MSAYCFFDVLEIHDQKKIDEYVERVEATVDQYQGRYVLIGGHWDVVEGNYQPVFPVIIEFPSLAQAHRWYDSEEYRDLKALRLSAATSNAFFAEGFSEHA